MKKFLALAIFLVLFVGQVQLARDGGKAFGLGLAGGFLGGAIGSAMTAPRETVVYTQPAYTETVYKQDTSNLEQQLAEQQAQIEELKQQLAQQKSDDYQEIE